MSKLNPTIKPTSKFDDERLAGEEYSQDSALSGAENSSLIHSLIE